MAHAPIDFEDHVVGVVNGLRACADGWSELMASGVPSGDIGLVVSEEELRRSGAPAANPRAVKIVIIDGRYIPLDRVGAGPIGGALLASRNYPAELIGDDRVCSGFQGLFSPRECRALADAIMAAGASIWVRSRTPDDAGRAAAVLLRISAERVRTFSRPAAFPAAAGRNEALEK